MAQRVGTHASTASQMCAVIRVRDIDGTPRGLVSQGRRTEVIGTDEPKAPTTGRSRATMIV